VFQRDPFGPWLERCLHRILPFSHFARRFLPLASPEGHRGFFGLPRPLLGAFSCHPFSNLLLVQHTVHGLGHDDPAASHSPNPVHDRVRSHAMTVVPHRHGGTGNHGLSPFHDRGHDRGHVLCPVHGGRDLGHAHDHSLCPGPVRGRGGHDPCPYPSLYLCHVGPCRVLGLSHGD